MFRDTSCISSKVQHKTEQHRKWGTAYIGAFYIISYIILDYDHEFDYDLRDP